MEDEITFKTFIINKKHILDFPEMYRDQSLLILNIFSANLPALIEFSKINKAKQVEITLTSIPIDPTDRARKFFFLLRDRVCEGMGDTSSEHKNHIYRSCIEELGVKEEGKLKRSVKQLTKTELWMATELMYQWSLDAEVFIADLKPEYDFLQKRR